MVPFLSRTFGGKSKWPKPCREPRFTLHLHIKLHPRLSTCFKALKTLYVSASLIGAADSDHFLLPWHGREQKIDPTKPMTSCVKHLPGTPNIVFPKAKIAVFIDGDFWHGMLARNRTYEYQLNPPKLAGVFQVSRGNY